MLIELRIENFAVIERLTVSLHPGLNVLTGETGAGKSIIVGALSLLLGERASTDTVRAGADRAVVEGAFDVGARSDLLGLLDQQGIPVEDGLLILRREVAAEGRNRAWVNGSASTAGLVGSLGGYLVDLHGQHEHQALLRPDAQRDILDAYAGHTEQVAELRAAHATLLRARREMDALDSRTREAKERADFLAFQLHEIEQAGIEADEEARLEEETRLLQHAEDLMRLAQSLHRTLYESEDSVTDRLGSLRRELDQLIRIDPAQTNATELLDSAYYAVEELGRRMGDYASRVELDPGRLDALQRRRDLLFRLRSKYGPTLADVLETGERARRELAALENLGFERAALDQEAGRAAAAVRDLAGRISRGRADAAARLEAEVMAILPALGLEAAHFHASLPPVPEPGAAGGERVEFLVAVNRGFDPRPLARVASGGELSRVMLALKTVLARLDAVPTLIFDEIDAGIGGRIAVRIGAQLKEVARHHQVFAITHLPQIASRADHHLLVTKEEDEDTTRVALHHLHGQDRVRELARMLGGDPDSTTSLEHARELLAAGWPSGSSG
jgi:DNA repair protein RecN (Recombination protein N)